MLLRFCLVMLILYAGALTLLYFWRCRHPAVPAVVLRIEWDYPAVALEWLLYSFRYFLDSRLPTAVWWVETADSAPPEQLEVLRRLMGRFAYRLPECYNQYESTERCYVFTAGPGCSPQDWQRQFSAQGGR